MSIDAAQIELTPEQKQRLASIAEREGKDYSAVVDELLSSVALPTVESSSETSSSGASPRNLLEAFQAVGALGCVKDAPPDLSTNPKYMEGFGSNASRRCQDSD